MADGYLRISEFGDRVGVSPDVLRAWERRYGLLAPDRSSGGYRLYSDEDVARVRRVQTLVGEGLSIAEAARIALEEAATPTASSGGDRAAMPSAMTISPPPASLLEANAAALSIALESYDEVTAQRALDELFVSFTPETVLRDVVLPELASIGRRWESGELDVAQEHFASNLLRGRLMAMARGWGMLGGPTAVLAAPPTEAHDLPLVIFGLALARRGWRITFLGSDTPLASLRSAVDAAKPDTLVLAAVHPAPFLTIEQDLRDLGERAPLAVAGRGASREFAARVGALHLADDPVTEAARLAGGELAAARSTSSILDD